MATVCLLYFLEAELAEKSDSKRTDDKKDGKLRLTVFYRLKSCMSNIEINMEEKHENIKAGVSFHITTSIQKNKGDC